MNNDQTPLLQVKNLKKYFDGQPKMGAILDHYSSLDEGVAYISMIFLFGGIGLVTYYFISRKHIRKFWWIFRRCR